MFSQDLGRMTAAAGIILKAGSFEGNEFLGTWATKSLVVLKLLMIFI